jgi:hypothetical protein
MRGLQSDRIVRVSLDGLDAWGVHMVRLEKYDDLPFGFFIAPGTTRRRPRRTGVFVSRVSLPALMPVMSVGDELLAVNGVPTKGRTLTDVQTMIGASNMCTLALRPVV